MKSQWIILNQTLSGSACDRVPGTDAYQIAKVEDFIAGNLRDPSSAEFRDTSIGESGVESHKVVCGYVNGKNGMGGYTGFTRFVADIEGVDAMIDPGVTATRDDYMRTLRACGAIGDRECQGAENLAQQLAHQAGFEGLWEANCAGRNNAGRVTREPANLRN